MSTETRKQGHSALRMKDGKLEKFDPVRTPAAEQMAGEARTEHDEFVTTCAEETVIGQLREITGLSRSGILRQALRTYQLVATGHSKLISEIWDKKSHTTPTQTAAGSVTAESLASELWEQWFCRAMTSKETWMGHVLPILRRYFHEWELIDGIHVRWDEEAKSFVGKKVVYSQSTDKLTTVAAVKDAMRLLVEFAAASGVGR